MKVCYQIHVGITLTDLYLGRDVGDRAMLTEIQQVKDNNPLYKDLGEEETKEAIDKLIVHWQEKKSNSCVTNKGVARGVFVTMEKIKREVSQGLHYQLFLSLAVTTT